MSQQLSEKLNLDVSPEVARALHRVVRAMHDGHCPKCGYLGPSEDFQRQYAPAPRKLVIADHICPDCGFRVTWEEAKAALVAFQPFMQANVELFERWRSGDMQMPSPIPHGVSYRPDVDNFYLDGTRAGMGIEFYEQWKSRCAEFPQLEPTC